MRMMSGTSACYSHQRTETITPKTYRVCFECGHVWTARALRRTYTAEGRALLRDGWTVPGDTGRSWWRRLRYRIRLATTRVRTIYFCPLCVHDF